MSEHHANVIIGGGPAGLNLAIEFRKRGIDHLLLEGRESVGGQWDRLPVCGQLISLNKKYVPGDDHTYKMRYDWHTLSSISAEDAARDPRLVFTEWTSEHWPSARTYKAYLQYVAREMGLTASIRTGAHVQRISRPDGRFRLEIAGLGPETCTFYQDFDAEAAAERYRNKIVIVIGRGNSAFEIAHHLVDITAETRVVTRSLPEFARQSHNVHDIRAQVADVFDLMQLKSNNNIVSDRITEVSRITSGPHRGRLRVRYETPCPHWSPPRWMRRTGIVDDIIVCCGFNYTMASIFDGETVDPATDDRGKYCLLTSTWESVNVPDLFFIGAPTRVNDPDAASGFVHGFRCNILALADIVAERYHDMPLRPVYETVVPHNDPAEGLAPLADYLVRLVSTTMPLFELFGFFGTMVTFDEQADGRLLARVWPPFPRRYNHERWGDRKRWVEIVFQYGFDRYGDGTIPTHYFTLPADHFDTSKSAYIHPVFHVYRDGIEVDQFHMQESLIGRWDIDDYVDEETNVDQYKNVAFNACASALGLDERRSMLPVREEFVDRCYPVMSDEEVADALRIQPTLKMLMFGNAS